MTRGFKWDREGHLTVRLSEEEVELLRFLVSQLFQLVSAEDEPGSGESPDDPGSSGEDDTGADELAAALGIRPNARRSDDPVLARLFPDAYDNDPEEAVEFRRFTESGLREGKRAAASVILETASASGRITLDREQAEAWLSGLNDVRLALGTRLDITEDPYEQLRSIDPDDERYAGVAAYDWLTFVQDTLVRALW